jgi:hypothetical protein
LKLFIHKKIQKIKMIASQAAEEINLVRTNPAGYVEYLETHLNRFVDDFVYVKPSGTKVRTKEGVAGEVL